MLSKEHVLLVATFFVVVVDSKPSITRIENEFELTMVREDHSGRTKREVGALPDYLNINLKVKGQNVKLRMRRSVVNVDAPVYFVDENGNMKKFDVPDIKNVGHYQDPETGAAIAVTANSKDGRTVRTYEGNFKSKGEHYTITPKLDSNQGNASLPEQEADQGILHKIHKNQKDKEKSTKKVHSDFKEIPILTAKEHESSDSQGTDSEEDGDGPGNRESASEEQTADMKLRILKELKEEAMRKARGHSRTKRQTQFESYHVEITFLVDHTLWEYWLQEANNDQSQAAVLMKRYLSHQMNGMDLAYKSIDVAQHQIMISVWLHNYVVATTKAASTWTATSITSQGSTYPSTFIGGDAVISKLGAWATQGGRGWSSPDHTMLWTRYNLFEEGTVGYAPIRGICQYQQGVSVVQDTGYHSWSTAAHELGHNLGAAHDGVSNACPANDKYIMTAAAGQLSASTLANAFTFSTCSINSMKELLQGKTDGYPRVCLTDKTCQHDVSLEGLDELPGVKYSTQEQCEIKDGLQAKFCDFPGEDICLTLWCSPAGDDNCRGTSPGAAEGTTCATGKWCRSGKCVSKADNPAPIPSTPNSDCTPSDLPSQVPAGCTSDSRYRLDLTDQNGNIVESLTCATIPIRGPHYCFTVNSAKTRCCADCTKAGLVTPTQHVEVVTPSPTPGVDGGWSAWSDWSICSVTCGAGTQSHQRSCTNPAPSNGGAQCQGDSTETRSCVVGNCPVNGGWGEWSQWGACSVTCDEGVQNRDRKCDSPPAANGGNQCSGDKIESRPCNAGGCPVNGGWTGWTGWTQCSVSCGTGAETRRRECTNPSPSNGGKVCDGSARESRVCSPGDCPVNGAWSAWGSWSSCSRSCDAGSQSRSRQCNSPPPANGGSQCVGDSSQSQACNSGSCGGTPPTASGNWGAWTAWNQCSVSCAGGSQTRQRVCDNPPPPPGGQDCVGSGTESQECSTNPCPVNGNWGGWDGWSACSATCGQGIRRRKRFCDNPSPSDGGEYCAGSNQETQSCKDGQCAAEACEDWLRECSWLVDYCDTRFYGVDLTKWCPKTCNKCGQEEPSVNGGWGDWTVWSECSATCGRGTIERVRECNNPPPSGRGRDCRGHDLEITSCNEQQCPRADPSCQDAYRGRCPRWAEVGECGRDPRWMRRFCPRSCNVCGDSGVVDVPDYGYGYDYDSQFDDDQHGGRDHHHGRGGRPHGRRHRRAADDSLTEV